MEDLEQPSPESTLTLSEAIKILDQNQQTFFGAAATLLHMPTTKNRKVYDESAIATGQAFCDTVEVILEDSELETPDRAAMLASVIFNATKGRVEYFQTLVPGHDFSLIDTEHEDISNNYQQALEEGIDPTSFYVQLIQHFANDLNSDSADLLEIVENMPKTRALHFMKSLSSQVGEVGKVATGVAIGGLALRTILKRLES